MPRRAGPGPGRERVLHALQRRLELREMPEQDGPHVVVGDPVEPDLRVHLGPVVGREETIALEPAGSHQDEDAKRGVAEAEALWRLLREETHLEVDRVEIAVVDLPDLLLPLLVRRDLLERGQGLHVEELAELRIARHSSLARA